MAISTNLYNETDTSSKSSGKKTKSQGLYDKIASPKRQSSNLMFPSDLGVEGNTSMLRFDINLPEGSKYGGGGKRMSGNSIRTDITIDMFMPSKIQTSYGTNWSWEDQGVAGTISELQKGNADLELGKALYSGMGDVVAAIGDGIGLNASSQKQLYSGTVKNPYMEILFEGIDPRNFSFTFKMIPRNSKEQSDIKKIVKAFKFHQAPEVKKGESNKWKVPSEFDIKFIYNGSENDWLHKISTCACTNVSVDYSEEGSFTPHSDGSPFSTSLTLEFKEMNILTKEDIEEGY